MGQTFSEYFQGVMESMHQRQMMAIMAKVKPEDIRLMETYEYEGVPLALDTLKSTMDDLKTFEIREDDVFIVTVPKAGTTWTQEIMSAIMHDGDIEKLNKKHTMMRAPFLEMTHGANVHDDIPRAHKLLPRMPRSSPRLIKSHLPGQLLPPQVWEKKIKIVYVIRNPKDVVVSMFHHIDMMAAADRQFSFDEVFDRFINGTQPYGKWWAHYLYFWERRNDDNILFLRFEDTKKDLRGTVLKISEFLGKSLSDDVIDAITDHCTFENMKKNPMTNPDTLLQNAHGGQMPEGKSFMRRGKVGGWKAQLSDAQSEAMDALCKEKLAGTGLTFE
ncbi:sulfotransferase 1E1-like [Patiria miniata]|uniref:Sulfotransferase domain-containing protein n=1 Tax=Patiria miniata TaxID=46514 RepID=A0A914ANH6_PATMI|nr:sulfotransferase 1E1-like [Patiria miniata]